MNSAVLHPGRLAWTILRWIRSRCAFSSGRVVALCWALLASSSAEAHQVSDSYLRIRIDGTKITGQWWLAVHDLEVAIGVDTNEDEIVTWGELKGRGSDILEYARKHLELTCDDTAVTIGFDPGLKVDHLANGAYAVLSFAAEPGEAPAFLTLDYRAFFDVNRLHRGLVLIEQRETAQQGIFNPVETRLKFECARPQPWREFRHFIVEGVWHIWIGYDHILFLITLLLPAVLRRESSRWIPEEGFGRAFVNVLKVVTAFTVAHSITLSLASTDLVRLPSRLVESAIAGSIVVAALNNLRPLITTRAWAIAFVFGLIHGFGFASVLADLGLPSGSLLRALVGFNLGVELGQLAIVAVFLPLAMLARRTGWYRALFLHGGSVVVALLAAWWMIERLRGS